ncbi:hypothetical protein [Neptunomonas marina]|uniref:hypothetical protein n=1 Tax=Neptunomonas marina TaxID=1815562 RepID=UPI0013E30F7E|nr:hypothetical protein [Neptunomonas marina]
MDTTRCGALGWLATPQSGSMAKLAQANKMKDLITIGFGSFCAMGAQAEVECFTTQVTRQWLGNNYGS